MPKFHLTMEFETQDELRAYLNAPAEEIEEPKAEDAPVRTDEPEVDSEGMPYDANVHSESKAFNADGTWRAMRGKADEAKAARAAWKAAGAGVAEPEPEAAPAPAMPGATAMPGASPLPADAPTPVSLEKVIEKINGMLSREAVDQDALAGKYAKHSGTTADKSFGVFQTNETARAALFADLCQIEPELS